MGNIDRKAPPFECAGNGVASRRIRPQRRTGTPRPIGVRLLLWPVAGLMILALLKTALPIFA